MLQAIKRAANQTPFYCNTFLPGDMTGHDRCAFLPMEKFGDVTCVSLRASYPMPNISLIIRKSIMPFVKKYYTRVPFGGQYVSHKDRESSKMPVPVSRVESSLTVWSVVSLFCDIMGMQGKFVLCKSIFPTSGLLISEMTCYNIRIKRTLTSPNTISNFKARTPLSPILSRFSWYLWTPRPF